ncbi:hypothetical protein ACQKGD_15550 [Peribacillus frigoritolerans]|uniref:hypothetical protein n=1 Tax=Peribacillus frigoritolerans TaxID=450367 RepID=UPI0020799B77|nr:hypothetical protein [Peribacillus frigoritolerans]USK64829.1 hypothetical protein LIT26_27620 [Peribacillus frigoritolerans]
MRKTLILGVTTMLTLGSLNGSLATIAHANENENPSNKITELTRASLTKVSSDSILEVAPYVHKDDQGFLYVDSNIPRDIYIKNKVKVLEKSFKDINKQVANGQVVVNDDLSITKKSGFTTFASKGYTSETFWWGQRAKYTNSQTKSTVKQLENAGQDIGFLAAALVWLPAIGGITGISAAYCGKLAKSMKSKNNGNGVILDMTWALVYSVKSR